MATRYELFSNYGTDAKFQLQTPIHDQSVKTITIGTSHELVLFDGYIINPRKLPVVIELNGEKTISAEEKLDFNQLNMPYTISVLHPETIDGEDIIGVRAVQTLPAWKQ